MDRPAYEGRVAIRRQSDGEEHLWQLLDGVRHYALGRARVLSGGSTLGGIDLREWGNASSTKLRGFDLLWLTLVLGAPGLILALLGFLLGGTVAAVVVLVLYLCIVGWWITRQGRAALTGAGEARSLGERDSPRLFNLVGGIANDLGISPPALRVMSSEEADAMIVSAGGPTLVVTTGLLDGYTRTELEAVVTHCLVRIAAGDTRRASLAAGLGSLAGPAGVSDIVGADARTVALTRYPPALASAIEKAFSAGGTRRWFHLVPGGPGAPPQAERIQLLRDL